MRQFDVAQDVPPAVLPMMRVRKRDVCVSRVQRELGFAVSYLWASPVKAITWSEKQIGDGNIVIARAAAAVVLRVPLHTRSVW